MQNQPSPTKPPTKPKLLVFAASVFAAELGIGLYGIVSESAISHLKWAHIGLSGIGLSVLLWTLRDHFRRQNTQPVTTDACFIHLPLPALIVNGQGIICDINAAAADLAGQSISDLLGKSAHNLFHPGQTAPKDCLLCQHIAASNELAATNFSFPPQRWQQISLSRLQTNSRDRYLELHVDISAQKQTEQQLASVIDGAELGYWDWDYVTGKHEVNQRWLDMLGLKQEELDNYVSDWASRIHPDDHDLVRPLIADHIRSGTPYVVEFRMQHKDGHWVWIQGSGAVVEYNPASGEPIRLCGTHQNITARKEFELNLRMAYQVISQSPSVALIWDGNDDLPISFATDNVKNLLGYSVAQLHDAHLGYTHLIHPDDLPLFRQELESCRSNSNCNDITHQQYRVVLADGSSKWIEDHKIIVRDEQGRIRYYQGLITDITQKRQQNNAIRTIASSSFDKVTDTTLDSFSQLALETLGIDYILIGEVAADGTHKNLSFCAQQKNQPQTPYRMHSSVCQHLEIGKIIHIEKDAHCVFPDDTWLSNQLIEGMIGIPWYSDSHRSLGFLLALYRHPIPDAQFAQDILKLFAAQITAEISRNRALVAMEFQKQRLLDAQAISHIGDWQWHWADNNFSWSDEMYHITGTRRSNFIPNFASFLSQLVHPDDRNLFKTSLQNTHKNEIIDFKHRIVLSNGEIRHVHQRGKVIRNAQQRATGIQGTMQDISQRLQTELRLLEAKHEAERANEIKSEFLANMSHEIRTPMNAIIGLVDLCLHSALNAKQRDYLERVETAAHGLMHLINDILDFSKMESGKLRLEPVPFLLKDMLDQVFSTMSELCRRKNLRLIRAQIAPLDYAVIGDPKRLQQVLINLIGNGIKFTELGHVEIEVSEVDRSERYTTLNFRISDTGIGMNEDQQARLFKAFSQGDSSITRNYGGTGLGLVICKQLVEQMGGSIKVESQRGKGSSFSFNVNLGIADPGTLPSIAPQTKKEFDTRQLQKISGARVLLVEDNEVNRIVACELLTQACFNVDTAENGEVALEKLKTQHYDCVLMDIQMPVMDGYAATRHLRKLPDCAGLPVIAMTANVMNDDRQKCLAAGMNDFIGKPILPGTFYNVLTKWIKPQAITKAPASTSVTTDDDIPLLYGIDIATGLLHTAGDKKVYRKILRKFAENHADTVADIIKAVSENNKAAAQQLTHTLKGLSGSLGAIQLQSHVQRLGEALAEQEVNAENTNIFQKLIPLIQNELGRIVESINDTLIKPVSYPQPKGLLSDIEIKLQLSVLLDKLQAFDSDADQQLELILEGIQDQNLINALLAIRKKIAHYQFVEAAQDLAPLIDFSDR